MATADSTLLLEARGLKKRFFGALALDGASFGLARGEIHALVGENGAGKSTFIKILAGVYQADGGEILLEGTSVDPAQHPLPIAFVHQDLALVDDLSVGENIALTAGYPRRGGLIDWPAVTRQAELIYDLMDVEPMDPARLVVTLSMQEKAILGIVRSLARAPVNIHEVLSRVRKLAETGFARGATFRETFDPSLPDVSGNFDQLVQVFLNLVRNAFDALPQCGGEIVLTSGYRPGVRFGAAVAGERLSLPIEITVRDNGKGIAPELMPHIFDPFVTTKTYGTGLGLALVAKIVGDHGGVVECDSAAAKTVFRILLPKAAEGA